MRAIYTDCLSVLQASDVVPDGLIVSEAWPSVLLTFSDKFFSCTAARCDVEWLASDGVVEGHFLVFLLPHFLHPSQFVGECKSRVFSIVPVEVADLVCSLEIAPEAQVVHHWLF